jgi:hypothetical protein
MRNGPSLWERRARNKKSMILKRQKQPERYKTKNNQKKTWQRKAKITAGKGCSESKWLAAKSATS